MKQTLFASLQALCTPSPDGSWNTRWSRFGDSVTLGGLALVHCLGLMQRWKLADVTRNMGRHGTSGFGTRNRRSSGSQRGGQGRVGYVQLSPEGRPKAWAVLKHTLVAFLD
jgi:hypothetical protein